MLNKTIKIIPKDKKSKKLPLSGIPNSIVDLLIEGEVKQRRVYGDDGKVIKDIDTSDHNKPKYHPMGAHKHIYDYSNDNPHGIVEYLTKEEVIQNSDIIYEGVNYYNNQRKRRNIK